jgi:hypothetical protein
MIHLNFIMRLGLLQMKSPVTLKEEKRYRAKPSGGSLTSFSGWIKEA